MIDANYGLSAVAMEIFKSSRGGDKLSFEGFVYRKNTSNITTQNWRCENKGCKGSVSTSLRYHTERQVVTRQIHNHPPVPARVEVVSALDKAMEQAETSDLRPRRIISDMNLSREATTEAPTRKAISQRIQRKRKHSEIGHEVAPLNRSGIIIPEKYKTTKRGEEEHRFLLYDNEDDGNDRLIVFSSEVMLDELSKNNIWMMDGTFKVAPTLFLQLYTIHVIIGGPNGHVFPCIYALLPNKTTQTYIKLFQILKDARPNLAPHLCIMDFELASKRALLTEFPQVSVAGCFFHLTQAVWRKVQGAGLTENYINQPEVREAVKSLCALAFLDVENVNEAFEQLQEYVEQMAIEGLTNLYDYFEDTYIGRQGRRGVRRNPQIPKEMWNVKERTISGIPRTTNKLEGWHRGIQAMLDSPHPSIFRCFAALQREENLQVNDLFRFKAGHDVQKSKKTVKNMNKRLTTLITRLAEGTIERAEFLRGVGYAITLNV